MARHRRRVTRALRPNVRATPYGLQVYTKVGGAYQSKRYPFEPTLRTAEQLLAAYDEEIRAWLLLHHRTPAAARGPKNTLAGGLPDYLEARAAMPTIAEREQHLLEWIQILGPHTKRLDVTPLQIAKQRDRWLTVGPKRVQVKGKGKKPTHERWTRVDVPLSSSSVNKRLRAFRNYYTVLEGPKGYNPVDTVEEPRESEGVPRAVTYPVLLDILAHMSDRPWRLKGLKVAQLAIQSSKAKARVEVLIWTGITSKELAAVTSADIRWEERYLVVRDRLKGEGAPGRLVPLVDEGIVALQRLVAVQGLGAFNRGVLLRAWQRACAAAGQPKLRIYDVRHSFITGYLRATRDMVQGQLIAGHKSQTTFRRYAAAAILPALEHGMAAFGAHAREPATPPTKVLTKSPTKSPAKARLTRKAPGSGRKAQGARRRA